MEEFGTYLKSHREKKGIRLEEIASITKIHLHNLELLESGHMEKLPPEPFIRGFITAYAKYVGLSPKETIEKYLQSTGGTLSVTAEASATHSPDTPMPVAAKRPVAPPHPEASEVMGKFQLPSWPKLITGAGVVAVAGISLLLIQVGKNADTVDTQGVQASAPVTEPTTENKPDSPAPDARSVATQPISPNSAHPAPTPVATQPATAQPVAASSAAAPQGTSHIVEIEGGAERTWVKVVVDNEPPVEFFLAPGKKVPYNAQQKIKVVLGNATNAKVIHNGEEATGKKFMGTIRSFRFPASAQFPQDIPKPAASGAESDGEKKSDD